MEHIVRQGDHLAGIAARYGLSFKVLWDAPENKELREQRKNPNVLWPGDKVFIPQPERHVESGSTEQRHRFRLKQPKLWLRIKLQDLIGRDVVGASCEIHTGDEIQTLTVADDGMVECQIAPTVREALLIVDGFDFRLRVGQLDPVEEISGQRERLRNLGYLDNPREHDQYALSDALRRFQRGNGQEETGIYDDVTGHKLIEVHGC